MKIGDRMSIDDKDLQHYTEESDDEDDSTTRSVSPDFIPYKTRPEWADVHPINIKTQTSIMDIKYTLRYEETFSYLRAMLVHDELSERSFALTADCLELQQSNFSVWYFRRRILKKLSQHLEKELAFVEKIIENEPKNYQVWHHRKTIVEWLQDGSHDKQLTASVLNIDNKNYHAWQHRQWLVRSFNLWDGELEFTDTQLAMDLRNNSAWNHRFFVLKGMRRHEDLEWMKEELQLTFRRIEQLPYNESSWSYLRGIILLADKSLLFYQEINLFCEELFQDKKCRSHHLLAFILDFIHEELTNSTSTQNLKTDNMRLKKRAEEICNILIENDRVRSRYWHYMSVRTKEL